MGENEFYAGMEDVDVEGGAGSQFMDFDTVTEYKPDPIIPNGKYHAAVRSVKADAKACCIIWEVVFHDTGIVASDGMTDVDGMTMTYRNWLPKPGDENEFSKSGKATKRQSKINMLKKFADRMRISMATPQIIAQAIADGEWIGLEVIAEVTASEWNGEVRNEINSMVAA
jgi:hypothetical protein